MRLSALAALALLLVACGPGGGANSESLPPFDPCAATITPGEEATSTERRALEDALDAWNRSAALRLAVTSVRSDSSIEVHFEEASPAFRGLYDPQRGVVFINSRLVEPRTRAVTIAHELGHAFGLPHIPEQSRASLMNPTNIELWPTSDDVTDLHALWGNCSALDPSKPVDSD